MPDKKPDWIWTSDVVMGWCDSAGCESIGHEANNCKLAVAFHSHLVKCAEEARREAFFDASGAMLEVVAEECHKQWAGWTEYLLSKCLPIPSGNLVLGLEWKDRWMRQVNTSYAELSEPEKDSDRREARKILASLARASSSGKTGEREG